MFKLKKKSSKNLLKLIYFNLEFTIKESYNKKKRVIIVSGPKLCVGGSKK